jgi:squalene-hopene/tetraprenyl-beta-curcumene cyclase
MTTVMPEGVAIARDLTGPALAASIDRLSPEVRAVAAYHLGLTDADGRPVASSGGKALRPALALLSARASGAEPQRGVPTAVAVELVHNFSLLHDDTAEVVLALRKCWPEHRGATLSYALPNRRAGQAEAAIQRGVRWMVGMQSKDGGWGAFDADNTRQLVNKLPFCDFGAVIDPPSADVTAHIVEALAAEGMAATKAARRGVTWLLKAQEPDGSWFGRWGANYVYGTGAVLPALIDAGVKRGKPCIRAAVRWLEDHQNDDGGWGEDLRSYDDPLLAGQGESTASQTAWALIGLLAAEGPEAVHSKAVQRGIEWLAQTQLDNGTWDEPLYTGTGFPGDFYINYHLYRLVFPISALGRYLRIAEQA